MSYMANTRASIYRGTIDTGLDVVDDNTTPVAGLESVRASLIEKSRKVYDLASGESRTIRWCVGRLDPGTPIVSGDRIKDNNNGKLYALDELTTGNRTIAGTRELVLDLRIL